MEGSEKSATEREEARSSRGTSNSSAVSRRAPRVVDEVAVGLSADWSASTATRGVGTGGAVSDAEPGDGVRSLGATAAMEMPRAPDVLLGARTGVRDEAAEMMAAVRPVGEETAEVRAAAEEEEMTTTA
jgi:hypothetical protein